MKKRVNEIINIFTKSMKHYQYIFAGAGLSGLMCAWQMAKAGHFDNAGALLIDRDPKAANDRTWCFWEKGKGEFDGIVTKNWEQVWFRADGFSRLLHISPYRYKMIRGLDFYRWIKAELARYPNVFFLEAEVSSLSDAGDRVAVSTSKGDFSAGKAFSAIADFPQAEHSRFPLLWQHFIGWTVETDTDVFDGNAATFMDFSVPQKGNSRFMYVLPQSSQKALAEYTLFSEKLLDETEYEEAIGNYLAGLGATDFRIVEKERGAIPMTVFPFWERNSENILHIGSAGGWTKASTGFTFYNTVKQAQRLAGFLRNETDLRKFHRGNRFRFYDRLLLDILHRHNEKGAEIFTSMFRGADPALVLKFLDEETSLSEDIRIIGQCPKGLFFTSLLRYMLGLA
jgi:lycopene beta-cyclase